MIIFLAQELPTEDMSDSTYSHQDTPHFNKAVVDRRPRVKGQIITQDNLVQLKMVSQNNCFMLYVFLTIILFVFECSNIPLRMLYKNHSSFLMNDGHLFLTLFL